MKENFLIGEHYRNRRGPYEVVNINGDQMVIRYEDGTLLSTTVTQQRRIVLDMEYDARAAAIGNESKQKNGDKGSRGGSSPPIRIKEAHFEGFRDTDFQPGTADTTWRSRKALGGVLAQRLVQRTSCDFQSWSVPRWPWVHIARTSHYRRKVAGAHADIRFEVWLDESKARFGLSIERGSASDLEGPVIWDWFRFLPTLSQNEVVQQAVQKAMIEHGVILDIGFKKLAQQVRWEENSLFWIESGERASITWSDVAQRLKVIDANAWVDVVMCRKLSKDDAIARGAAIVDDIIPVFLSLLPVYEAVTGLK